MSIASQTCSLRCADEPRAWQRLERHAHLRAVAVQATRRATAAACPSRAGASRVASPIPSATLARAAEPEIVRHFTALADRTFGVDTGFYPLGSCTMKHNPRERTRRHAARFRDLHPHADDEDAQAPRAWAWRLQGILAEALPRGDAAACGRPAGRADRAHAHARVLRRSRRGARHDHHGRHRARDEPGERDDGGLQAGTRRDGRVREPRPRRSARESERPHGRACCSPTPRLSDSSTR